MRNFALAGAVSFALAILLANWIAPARFQTIDSGQAKVNRPRYVAPNAIFSIEAVVRVSGVPKGVELEAVFDGDRKKWPHYDLSQHSRDGDTFVLRKLVRAPSREGWFFDLSWRLKRLDTDSEFGRSFRSSLSVECNDGVFCNGEERYVDGSCVESKTPPCKNSTIPEDPCSNYACDEGEKRCSRVPMGGASCAACKPKACVPDCGASKCGDDGCGGTCGEPCRDGLTCYSGECRMVTQFGSCSNPEPLFDSLGGGYVVPSGGISAQLFGDNSEERSIDIARPICQMRDVPEYVYKFVIAEPTPMGVDARLTHSSGDPNEMDSLLAIHDGKCRPFELAYRDSDVLCSDDENLPRTLSSRCHGLLPPGNYTLVASAHESSQLGPYKLSVRFSPNCAPDCQEKRIGDSDGCGGTCGIILRPPEGSEDDSCRPQCDSRMCGRDGCGGSCGRCKSGQECDDRSGRCSPSREFCDPTQPMCSDTVMGAVRGRNGSISLTQVPRPASSFCGSDCRWHDRNEPMPDLCATLDRWAAWKSISFEWLDFAEDSCAVLDGCVSSSGRRLVMRFDANITNTGTVDFVLPSKDDSPQSYRYSECRRHHEFIDFALSRMYAEWGPPGVSLLSHKVHVRLGDDGQHMFGPGVACGATSSLSSEKSGRVLPAGRVSTQSASSACNWLDVTDLPERCWYVHMFCVNYDHYVPESTYENNCAMFPVYVPNVPDEGVPLRHNDAVESDGASSFAGKCKPTAM